ncbi:NAD(P)-dependent dehydrogenase (short-subunit alcohol dehydrogenase family) [Actinoplanes lutulentus]|uniref:NAD(P)-dependent dehydrogenase (Short-subunit alcohol dehydrogenase family) n=1 Tax=Actinoplanes lutulentus TaxID=1287878 RepID=A0A327Z1U8_9ACTN|nr:coniferyl-alcohol dehydrogenase [Actinoplanes lutulentus]MBB2943327.1 NAD(P)-dependent dehydrogenase (short-subunit alcohol dehydrogenase family) [Actinoplanes lutulentus]RAK28386.1 NAD(P)-dependent dehydrogenase (short-subunit alcohol dehydrogenase family) [Actinoplanes lutulentus]
MNFPEYRGQRVIVTGCTSGIGRATAQALIALGAEVHGMDLRTPDGLDLASFVQIDLSEPASIESGAAQTPGPVRALFNCSGASPLVPPLDILKVNFLGTRLLTERIAPLMPAGGAIVSVSSDGGGAWRRSRELIQEFVASATFDEGLAWYEKHKEQVGHPYAFGKEALNVWTMIESAKLIQRGIRINTSSPGAVQTPMLEQIEAAFPVDLITATEQPIGRRSSALEQVGPLLFLNSDSASYVNGADLPVDGGYWALRSVSGQLD